MIAPVPVPARRSCSRALAHTHVPPPARAQHTFHCAADVRADPELAAAVYALGSHNPTGDAAAQAMDVPLWGSELEVADPGGTDLATTWARLYNSWNVTGYVLWNAVSAYHPKLFAPDQGIFRAWWPWNGVRAAL